jgi:hypothetical protein
MLAMTTEASEGEILMMPFDFFLLPASFSLAHSLSMATVIIIILFRKMRKP